MNKQPSFLLALFPPAALIAAAAYSIPNELGMFLPLIIGIVATSIVGMITGNSWDELQEYMKTGVSRALPAIFILFIIGTIVGSWMLSGTIPSIIYYGLEFIKPSLFLPTIALTTGIVAITLGSSFTAIATVGVAFMAIGAGMGIPDPFIVGALVSGAFFGDKISPLSDTTNIAPAMVGVNLFDHVRHMLWDTIPAFAISLILFWFLGLNAGGEAGQSEKISSIMNGLTDTFTIHPLLLALPVITIVLIVKRLPAVPSLVIVSVTGGIVAFFVQDSSLAQIMGAMTDGFAPSTSSETLNALFDQGGGVTSMLPTIGLIITATALGGVLEGTGIFTVLLNRIVNTIQSTGSLVLRTVLSTLVVAFTSGEQYLSVILPSRAMAEAYEKQGIHPKNLSRTVEAAGTVGINLVPWGVTALFVSNITNVSPYSFIPFIFFAYLVIGINLFYGYTGISITKADPQAEQDEKQEGDRFPVAR
ncbi:Na+/H+ antiporter NhaC [Pontibacillus salipaludis]|uniref:Na+/H+ antiporter NhaC n=1 Tax=Pontibacillus salipaludis TaxID=1697394 RepID=A0ABQ1QHA9_9BACI|nr:Na+/H+ antiporter NhaC [Pontibacillus salipaludis]GGD26208.1 Na+/H+ antiporter NhaC [Pontibacillus salipaludis]